MDPAPRLPDTTVPRGTPRGTRQAPGAAPRPPLLVISLDFELYWGVRDVISLDAYRKHLEGVRVVVPRLLELFRSREVRATWATVGFVMLDGVDELRANAPLRLPAYRNGALCPYAYLARADGALERGVHFAPELVERIVATPGQELASHTFSHFYCLEEPIDLEAFRADLTAARAVARSRYGATLASLVFPRNQYSPEHVAAAAELGMRVHRGNPQSWMYRPRAFHSESAVRRAARLADAFLPLSRDLSHALHGRETVNVAASRYLRPWTPAERWADPLRVARIRGELRNAAERGRAYHLWWHPHNFGAHPDENLASLGAVLDAFDRLRVSHGMRSATMAEAGELASEHAHA